MLPIDVLGVVSQALSNAVTTKIRMVGNLIDSYD